MSSCSRQTVNLTDTTNLKPVIFTSNAAKKVAELIQEENNPKLKLRAYIEGGGCSGLQYGFTFDENATADDQQFITDGITLLIDAKSFAYLAGAEIDYVEDVQGERFTIKNPNAKSSCGCGTSFDINDENNS